MVGNIILGIVVVLIIVMFGIFCGACSKELARLDSEIRELKRRQKERNE